MESTKWNPLESKPDFVECETTSNVQFRVRVRVTAMVRFRVRVRVQR